MNKRVAGVVFGVASIGLGAGSGGLAGHESLDCIETLSPRTDTISIYNYPKAKTGLEIIFDATGATLGGLALGASFYAGNKANKYLN